MTVTLSQDELDMIECWYAASAGESAHESDEALFVLLEKLGFDAHCADLYQGDPSSFIESHQPIVEAHNAAIRAYRERHPEMKSVRDAIHQERTTGLSK